MTLGLGTMGKGSKHNKSLDTKLKTVNRKGFQREAEGEKRGSIEDCIDDCVRLRHSQAGT